MSKASFESWPGPRKKGEKIGELRRRVESGTEGRQAKREKEVVYE